MSGLGTSVPNGIVPLLSYIPSLVKERLFLSIIVPALKIGSFLFIGGTIVPINGSGLNEMNSLFLDISSYLCKMVPIKNDSSFLQFVQQKHSSTLAIYAFVAI